MKLYIKEFYKKSRFQIKSYSSPTGNMQFIVDTKRNLYYGFEGWTKHIGDARLFRTKIVNDILEKIREVWEKQ